MGYKCYLYFVQKCKNICDKHSGKYRLWLKNLRLEHRFYFNISLELKFCKSTNFQTKQIMEFRYFYKKFSAISQIFTLYLNFRSIAPLPHSSNGPCNFGKWSRKNTRGPRTLTQYQWDIRRTRERTRYVPCQIFLHPLWAQLPAPGHPGAAPTVRVRYSGQLPLRYL